LIFDDDNDYEQTTEAPLDSDAEEDVQPLEEDVQPTPRRSWEDDVGDSCCFGTRTVRTMEIGMDCVWRIHGGV
jgi:hypothetical protein